MDETDKEFRFFCKFRDPARKIKTQTVRRLLKPFEWTLDDYDLLSDEEKREVDRRLRKSKTFLVQRRLEAKYLEPRKEYQKWLRDEREKITGHQFTMMYTDFDLIHKIKNKFWKNRIEEDRLRLRKTYRFPKDIDENLFLLSTDEEIKDHCECELRKISQFTLKRKADFYNYYTDLIPANFQK